MSRRSRIPNQEEERRLHKLGYQRVAGIDEVGRGPLAGPVVAAAVVLSDLKGRRVRDLSLIRDSKLLSPRQRERAAEAVRRVATASGIGVVSSQEIDSMGIAPATRLAMRRALEEMPQAPDHLLVDAFPLSWKNRPYIAVVGGDRRCTAIAAASVLAKVYRDALMVASDACYPGYGFASHKGYATRAHFDALARLGPTPIHRRSFSPLRQTLPLQYAEHDA